MNDQDGFNLLELMVVVSIIGALVIVALPIYHRYQIRAKQSEAKLSLAAAYTAEQSFFSEHGSYSACLKDIGLDLSTQGSKYYYTIGFSSISQTDCGPAKNLTCLAYSFLNNSAIGASCQSAAGSTYFSANARALGSVPLPNQSNLTSGTVQGGAFTVHAVGSISDSNTSYDEWTINQDKNLVNSQSGL